MNVVLSDVLLALDEDSPHLHTCVVTCHMYMYFICVPQEVDITDVTVKRMQAMERLRLNPADVEARVLLQYVEQQVRGGQDISHSFVQLLMLFFH